MNAEKLFEAIGAIDEEILERSETPVQPKRRFSFLKAIAACLTLAITLSLLYVYIKKRISDYTAAMPPTITISPQSPRKVVDYPFYNEGHLFMVATENLNYTMNALSAEQTNSLLPDELAQWMDFSGVGMFLEDGKPYRLYLSTPTTTTTIENGIGIIIGPYTPSVAAGDDAVYYRCGNVEYAMWEDEDTESDNWEIGAQATIHGVPVYFQMDKIASADLETAKADLEALLLCFSACPAGRLDFSGFVATTQPHSWLLDCTKEEVESRSEYSILLPQDEGLYKNNFYKKYSICFTNFDFVSIIAAEFRKGGDVYLRWFISYAEGWSDEETSPSPSLIYARELSLEKVEEMVSNSKRENDGEISFTVNYGDAVINIEAMDVSAQWLYDQLIAVRQRLELSEFQTMVANGLPEGVTLKIYYMDPTILTFYPWSGEDLKDPKIFEEPDTPHYSKKGISVDHQTLLAHTDSLQKLSVSGFHTHEGEAYENARMCYVFEDAEGNTLLQVSFNGPDPDYVYVNSHPAKYDPMYMDIIEPFLTEEFYDTWKYE